MNKDYHLTTSKSFCMLPWVHLHATPKGTAAACCISKSCSTSVGMGDVSKQSMFSIMNSDSMVQLRKDMLSDVLNPECNTCYVHEQQNVSSARQVMNRELQEFYEESIENTNTDGTLKELKMRFFDIRFSNICNFKCRTCGSGYSSQWEQEELKSNSPNITIYPKNDNSALLNEVLSQVPNIRIAYFAGGEPLITEEHYVILEEMIKTGVAKHVQLRYNTNASNLRYKDRDLLSMWKHFSKGVNIDASIDHYGERAEYIRHGTVWSTVEENIKQLRALSYVSFRMNTVLSVFNLLTINDFYEYLIKNDLYNAKDNGYLIYNMVSPEYLSCHLLPPEYKVKGRISIIKTMAMLGRNNFSKWKIALLQNALTWTTAYDMWDEQKVEFKNEINRIDNLRNEDFRKTFPELAGLLDIE
jgi:organic radical activating enzyme